MPAAVTVSPAKVAVGDTVAITATGFLPNTILSISIPEFGIETKVLSDASGAASSDDLPDKAVGTLTSDGVNVIAAETVTIDGIVYTFRAAVTTTANEVKIGVDAATSLANLKKAINLSGVGGTDYGSLTVIHPTVGAGVLTATTLVLFAKTGGTAGNTIPTVEASTHLSFGAATLLSGTVTTGISSLLYSPTSAVPFTVRASDGTSTATTRVSVFTK